MAPLHRGWWCHPGAIIFWCLLVFVPARFALGGASYLPSRAWYFLCFVIPAFVALGLGSGSFCVPLRLDAPTAFHVVALALYLQIDLSVSRWVVGPTLGTWSLLSLVKRKVSCWPELSPLGFAPPLARTLFEFNGALAHEIFWNIFICQNFLHCGLPAPLALLAVPAVSCLVHAITSNLNVGLRCFPNFIWVALAYHASGSVLPPALIHALWYVLDAKLVFLLTNVKREWDFEARVGECGTPSWDKTCTLGTALILLFYVPLNLLSYWYPELRSDGGLQHEMRSVHPGFFPAFFLERSLVALCLIQLLLGMVTLRQVLPELDRIALTGDFREAEAPYMLAEREDCLAFET